MSTPTNILTKPTSQHLRPLVLNKILSLKNLLEEIERFIPRFGPTSFLSALKLVVDAIYSSFIKQTKAFEREANDSELVKVCLKHLAHIQIIHESYLDLVQNIDTSFIHPELQSPITRFIERFQRKENFALFLRPFWDYTYEILCYIDFVKNNIENYEERHLNDRILKQIKKFPKWFIFIFYPYLEHKNALLNTLIAHEIGHFVDYNFSLHTRVLRHVNIRVDKKKIDDLVNEMLEQPVIPGTQLTLQDIVKREKLTEQIRDKCGEILESWLKEFIADVYAVRLMGPCYFFAMYELATITRKGIDSYSLTHPSWRIRLLKLLDELENLEFFAPESKYGLANSLMSMKTDLDKPNLLAPQDEHHRIVYDSLFSPGAFEGLQHALRLLIPRSLSYSAAQYSDDVEKLTDCLLDGIPPSEIWDETTEQAQPALIPSIMNAGWEVYLEHPKRKSFFRLTNARSSRDEAIVLQNLNELLLKAIESSDTLDEWRSLERNQQRKS